MGVVEIQVGNFPEKEQLSGNLEQLVARAIRNSGTHPPRGHDAILERACMTQGNRHTKIILVDN